MGEIANFVFGLGVACIIMHYVVKWAKKARPDNPEEGS